MRVVRAAWTLTSMIIVIAIASQFSWELTRGPNIDLFSFVAAYVAILGAIAALTLALAQQMGAETDDRGKMHTAKVRTLGERLVHLTIIGVEAIALRYSLDQILKIEDWNWGWSIAKTVCQICLHFVAITAFAASVGIVYRLSNILWMRQERREPFW